MKNRFIGGVLLITVLPCILPQCSVEKRRYTRGYHVCSRANTAGRAFAKNKWTPVMVDGLGDKTAPVSDSREMRGSARDTDERQIAFAARAEMPASLVSRMIPLPLPPDSCPDLITLMNGDELRVKIEEFGPSYVKYKRCDYLTGPTIATSTENIFRIKQANGMIRVFDHPRKPESTIVPAPPAVKARDNGWAIASFVTGLFAWLILPAPLALIFGLVGLSQIKNSPEKYKGRWMAIVGTIFGGLVTGFLLFILAFNI